MNELFAAEPAACKSASDLQLLLNHFGPYAGRYLASYPLDWVKLIEIQFQQAGEMERARISALLRRAKDSLALVPRNGLAWDPQRSWLVNAQYLLDDKPPLVHGLVASKSAPPRIHSLEDMELPITAEERVEGTATEYARVCRTLLLLSPEISLIDPFLDPLKRTHSKVLEELLSVLAKGKCERLTLWTRAPKVGSDDVDVICADIKNQLQKLARYAGIKPGRHIEILLMRDETSKTKMHGRYLLSIKGGVRFDQGFQALPEGRMVDVGPIGKSAYDELWKIYVDAKHDMQLVNSVQLKV